MNIARTLGCMALTLGIAACTTSQVKQDQYSGYLGNLYGSLQPVTLASGEPAQRWVDPAVSIASYKQLMLEPTVLYPATQGNSQVSQAEIQRFAKLVDAALKRELGSVTKLTTKPGPNTLRLRPAITAVGTEAEGLKPYEVVPIALVVAGATAAAGARDRNVVAYTEVLAEDAQTGKVVGASLKKGFGKPVDNDKQAVDQDHLQVIAEQWAKDAAATFKAALAKP